MCSSSDLHAHIRYYRVPKVSSNYLCTRDGDRGTQRAGLCVSVREWRLEGGEIEMFNLGTLIGWVCGLFVGLVFSVVGTLWLHLDNTAAFMFGVGIGCICSIVGLMSGTELWDWKEGRLK